MMRKGYFKVGQSGGSYVVATLYNPETEDVITMCVRDYDYSDCSRDNDEIYNMPIDEDARRMYLHKQGIILVGDKVEVFKGRKVKIGTIATVSMTRKVLDKYGRWVATYACFDNGQSTNVTNCRLIE